jgi:hypothetical protein
MAASALYVLVSGLEMALARIAQEDRECADEKPPDPGAPDPH